MAREGLSVYVQVTVFLLSALILLMGNWKYIQLVKFPIAPIHVITPLEADLDGC